MKASILCLIAVSFLFLSFHNQTPQKEKKKIMAIFAHPDDEAVTSVGPILAKYAREGHPVDLVFATKGERGVNKRANIPAGEPLAKARAAEAACTTEKLGIQPPILLGLDDGSLATSSFTGQPLRDKLDSLFQLHKPDVVITWGPDGGYGHMDHRLVHAVVTELFQSGQYPWFKKLFYTAIPTEHFERALNMSSGVKDMYAAWKPVKKAYLTTRISYSKEDMDKAVAAMYCHNSQFSKQEMEDTKRWMIGMNKDTVYLRPFLPQQKTTNDLFK